MVPDNQMQRWKQRGAGGDEVNKTQMLMYNGSRGTGALFLTSVRGSKQTRRQIQLHHKMLYLCFLPCVDSLDLRVSHPVEDVFVGYAKPRACFSLWFLVYKPGTSLTN